MKINAKRISCAIMASVMLFSLAACTSDPGGSSSEDVEIEYEYVYVDGNSSEGTSGSSGQGSGSSSQGSSGGKNSSTSSGGGSSSENIDVSKYKGTTVRYATWQDPELDEDGPVIKAFEQKYGINVEIDLISEGDYANTVAGYIASGNSPDVYFCNSSFPSALTCLQPIDAAGLDLSDEIWDQGMLDLSTINGKTYLVNTVGNIWNEVDMVFYNKKLLNDNNITTPEDYYNAGKWTFDAMKKVMSDVKALGDNYIGGYIDFAALIGSTGASFYNWENGKFSNGIDNTLKSVMNFMATCYKEGLVRGYGNNTYRDDFINGRVGIAVTNAYGLKKTGYWRSMNTDHIGFTYMPDTDANTKAVATGLYRGWGIIKGAKNPEAAGVFLRYYLDVNNYDTADAFISSEAESFFFKLTSGITTDKKNFYFYVGTEAVTGTTRAQLAQIAMNDPSNVNTAVESIRNTINSDVNSLNDFVSKQTQ